MLAAVGVVFLRVESEPHARSYVNYTVPSSGEEGADHTVLFGRRPWRARRRLGRERSSTVQGRRQEEAYGSGKLIPPTEVLEDTFMTLAEERLRAQITERILSEADLNGQVAEAVAAPDPPDGEALRRDIENGFADAPEAEWRDIIEAAADEPS